MTGHFLAERCDAAVNAPINGPKKKPHKPIWSGPEMRHIRISLLTHRQLILKVLRRREQKTKTSARTHPGQKFDQKSNI